MKGCRLFKFYFSTETTQKSSCWHGLQLQLSAWLVIVNSSTFECLLQRSTFLNFIFHDCSFPLIKQAALLGAELWELSAVHMNEKVTIAAEMWKQTNSVISKMDSLPRLCHAEFNTTHRNQEGLSLIWIREVSQGWQLLPNLQPLPPNLW